MKIINYSLQVKFSILGNDKRKDKRKKKFINNISIYDTAEIMINSNIIDEVKFSQFGITCSVSLSKEHQ